MDDKNINPILIQRFLVLNKMSMKKTRILNQFVYTVSPKQYLSIAWSLLFVNGKKINKAPFIRYLKKKKEVDKYPFVLEKVKHQYKMSDKDLNIVKKFIIQEIEKDKPLWFSYYGVNEFDWKSNHLDVNLMKEYGDRPKMEIKKGLNAFM